MSSGGIRIVLPPRPAQRIMQVMTKANAACTLCLSGLVWLLLCESARATTGGPGACILRDVLAYDHDSYYVLEKSTGAEYGKGDPFYGNFHFVCRVDLVRYSYSVKRQEKLSLSKKSSFHHRTPDQWIADEWVDLRVQPLPISPTEYLDACSATILSPSARIEQHNPRLADNDLLATFSGRDIRVGRLAFDPRRLLGSTPYGTLEGFEVLAVYEADPWLLVKAQLSPIPEEDCPMAGEAETLEQIILPFHTTTAGQGALARTGTGR